MVKRKKNNINLLIVVLIIVVIIILILALLLPKAIDVISDKVKIRTLPVEAPLGISDTGWLFLKGNSQYIETYRGIDLYEGFPTPNHKDSNVLVAWFIIDFKGDTHLSMDAYGTDTIKARVDMFLDA